MSERRAFFREIAQAAMGARYAAEDVLGEPSPALPAERYGEAVNVEGWSGPAQARLGEAAVLVAGAGALGSPVAMYLAAAGVGRLGVVDPGEVELEALHRQLLHFSPDVGVPKAPSAAVKLGFLNPDIQVEPYQAAYLPGMAAGHDLVLDCTGALAIPGAGLAGWAAGARGGVIAGACAGCALPDGPPLGEPLGPVAGVVGSLMAMEALRRLSGQGPHVEGETLRVDLSGPPAISREPVHPRPGCPDCAAIP